MRGETDNNQRVCELSIGAHVILAHRKFGLEDQKFEASQSYTVSSKSAWTTQKELSQTKEAKNRKKTEQN